MGNYSEKRNRSLTGFTLIELMVVIAIIAVLAAVVAPQVFKQVEKARIASVETFYNSLKTAATSYYTDTGSWPPDCDSGVGPGNCNTLANGFMVGGASAWDGPYLETWPRAAPWGGWLCMV